MHTHAKKEREKRGRERNGKGTRFFGSRLSIFILKYNSLVEVEHGAERYISDQEGLFCSFCVLLSFVETQRSNVALAVYAVVPQEDRCK